ncbi:NAD-dependent succinate-semialdehyde dehydrogenase [Plantibacter sp. YIM 135249]|uniref:NAD-dependent succinate-semialdehyde dehydrogenase n=1 Tax=Plantibacter sp. YIM 135249 TaxID=3423918 RepID=UPI003D3332DC
MSTSTAQYPAIELLVDGRWIGTADRESAPIENPATRGEIGAVPLAVEADIDAALAAADRAFEPWRDLSPHRRTAILMRAAELLRERRDDIAVAMTLENGKPYGDSLGEVDYTADIIDSLATEGPRRFGAVLPTGADEGRTLVVPEPVGPVAAFTPWNYPLTVPGRKIAAALAAGCTVIIKAAEETPASAVALAHALVDAGLPDGVLNLLFGDPAQISERLIASRVIRKVSFTGSIGVGKHLATLAGAAAKPTMLELGGHAPVIVFEDADVDEVALQSLGSKIHNSGQSCGSPTRFYLHESIHDRFVARFAELLEQVRLGDGFDPSTEMGPLANARRYAAMQPLVDDAVARGAGLAAGGTGDDTAGYFYRPTLLTRVPDDALTMLDEPFGPIASTSTFTDEDEVLGRANALPYGLAAYVFTADATRALRVPRRLDVGMVSVNRFGVGGRDTFFGGRKESGYGSEGGPEAVEEYLVKKLIAQA